jgi:hypothetical protein
MDGVLRLSGALISMKRRVPSYKPVISGTGSAAFLSRQRQAIARERQALRRQNLLVDGFCSLFGRARISPEALQFLAQELLKCLIVLSTFAGAARTSARGLQRERAFIGNDDAGTDQNFRGSCPL